MPAKETRVGVESLRPVAVLYEGDIHELDCLLLRLWEGKDRETNARNTRSVVRSRPTVGWLARSYSMLVSDVSTERVKQVLVRHGLPLGTIVDNEPVREVVPAGLRLVEGTSRRRASRKPPGE